MTHTDVLELIRNGESSKVEALREGLVNAVCHRDYAISGSARNSYV